MNSEQGSGKVRAGLAGGMLAVLLVGGAAASEHSFSDANAGQTVTTHKKFYCNINALNAAERAHHKELGDKLMALKREVVETEKGYEFQYSPSDVSLAELADWVAAEGKCCPFFDFHIDLENRTSLLCLRLTGEEGIKEFIRTEFALQKK